MKEQIDREKRKTGPLIVKEKYRITVIAPRAWEDLIKKRAEELGFMTMTDYILHLIRVDLIKAGHLKVSNVEK